MLTRMNRSEVRSDDETNKIRGVGAVYYTGDPGTEFEVYPGAFERIMPGAFDRAIEQDDVVGLFNHDPTQVLGRTSSNTMRLTTTERGLEYEIDPAETTISQDVREHITRGDVTGSSFAFTIPQGGQRWTREEREGKEIEIREITEVKLFDTGPVTYPAYSATDADVREARAARESHLEPEVPPETMDQDVVDHMPKYRARAAIVGLEAMELTE